MRNLTIEQKTGFSSIMPFRIVDNKGVLFYDSEFTDHIANGEKLSFNLPVGQYSYDGNFTLLPAPVKQKTIILPLYERNIQNGKKYKVIFGVNKNKCSIFYEPGIILFDNQFKTKPLYLKYGIYFHELGHHYYKTEWKADLYSIKKMYDLGFNSSQIGRLGLEGLTDNSFERQLKIINKVTT